MAKGGRKRGTHFKPNDVQLVAGLVVVTLSQGQVAVVDACDYPLVSGHRWAATKPHNTWYAIAFFRLPDGRETSLFMHRLLLGLGHGDNRYADHRDGDGLNNTRENLRIATPGQNSQNRPKQITAASSRYKGVSLCSISGRWRCSIFADGKSTNLGRFDTEREAALAYNCAALELHGDFARINVITE